MAQFTNQASLSYNGITINSNIVTGELTQTLTVGKEALTSTYRTGDELTYVVSLRNTGTIPYTGLTVTDDLGAYTDGANTRVPLDFDNTDVLFYVNGVLQANPTVTAGPPLTITGIDLPAGANGVLVYRTTVNGLAPLGDTGTIVNTASVSGAGLAEAIAATDTVTADNATRLTVVKALEPSTVAENGQITYTFTVQNLGDEATAAAGIQLNDTFNPRLNAPITVTLNGAVLTQAGNYTYDPGTGVFSTTPGIVTVPAATQTQDPVTGVWSITPGTAVLTVSGTL